MSKLRIILLILLLVLYACSGITESVYDQPYGITIRCEGPRGSNFFEATGRELGFRVFRIQVINDSIVPAEFTINFSNDSLVLLSIDSISNAGFPESERYLKVFLFPESITPEKQEEAYNFGIVSIDSFLNSGLNKSTILTKTIQPKEDYFFYIGALIYPSFQRARSDLFMTGQNLVYKFMVDPPLDSVLIPCGQIVYLK